MYTNSRFTLNQSKSNKRNKSMHSITFSYPFYLFTLTKVQYFYKMQTKYHIFFGKCFFFALQEG